MLYDDGKDNLELTEKTKWVLLIQGLVKTEEEC